MKKKKLSLSKKLFVQKEVVGPLNNHEQHQVIGGGPRTTYGCPTWLPNAGCYTETTPRILCN